VDKVSQQSQNEVQGALKMRQQRSPTTPQGPPVGPPQIDRRAMQQSTYFVHRPPGFRQRHVPFLHFLLQQSFFWSQFCPTFLQAAAASPRPSRVGSPPSVPPTSKRPAPRRVAVPKVRTRASKRVASIGGVLSDPKAAVEARRQDGAQSPSSVVVQSPSA
jgi:hypothetical protein